MTVYMVDPYVVKLNLKKLQINFRENVVPSWPKNETTDAKGRKDNASVLPKINLKKKHAPMRLTYQWSSEIEGLGTSDFETKHLKFEVFLGHFNKQMNKHVS